MKWYSLTCNDESIDAALYLHDEQVLKVESGLVMVDIIDDVEEFIDHICSCKYFQNVCKQYNKSRDDVASIIYGLKYFMFPANIWELCKNKWEEEA